VFKKNTQNKIIKYIPFQHQATIYGKSTLPQKTTLGANKMPWMNKIPGAS
jgi:hypothetical protein